MARRDAEGMLRAAGLRRTRGRVALLTALLDSPRPLAHDEACRRVRRHGLDRVTVYRALEAFLDAGIVHRLQAGERWRFAVCGRVHRGHCHPHFTCRVCGAVECLSDVPLPRPKRLGRAYRVEEQEFYMRGVCARCAGAGGGT